MNRKIHLKVGNTSVPVDPDAQLRVQHVRNIVGAFYESLAAYMFDAEHWEGGPIYADERDREYEDTYKSRYREGGDTPVSLTPDLVRRKNSTYIEVKGTNHKSVVKAYTWQARLYDRIRQTGQIPIYRPRVQYAFFVHGLSRITKTLKTTTKTVEGLARNTQIALLVDLDIVLAFREWCGVREYGSPEGRSFYPEFYCLTPWKLKELHRRPRCCLDQLIGADQVNFRVNRRLIGARSNQLQLTHRLLVDGTPLAPFELVTIQRKRNSRPPYTGPLDASWYTRQEKLLEVEPEHPLTPQSWDDEEIPF